jgi:hypothetical protein
MPYTNEQLAVVDEMGSHCNDADYLLNEAYFLLFNCNPGHEQWELTREAVLHAIMRRHNGTKYEHC